MLSRRGFFHSSIAGVGAAVASSGLFLPRCLADDSEEGEAATPRGAPASLFLTWRTDPTTTMVIQWIGPGASMTALEYSFFGADDWKGAVITTKDYPDTDLKVYRCELTGLAPGSEYAFRLSESAPPQRFRTMPAKSSDVIQFVSGGDCGTGSHAVATNILAARQEPYFALLGGDLAYDNGRSPETFLKFLENYSLHMIDPQGRLIPMLSCLGNHEVNGGYNGQRSAASHYLSVFDGLYSDTSYGALDFGDYLSLVLLDTGHLSPIEGEQTTWLRTTLTERRDRPHLIVANHVPAYPSYRKESTGEENRKHWCPLFEELGVDVVLEHHDHTFKRTHPMLGGMRDQHGIPYLGDGSWGKLRPLKEPEERPYLARYSESYHVAVHRLEDENRFHVALTDSGKVADVCATFGKRPLRQ